jgi:hypothetical protein
MHMLGEQQKPQPLSEQPSVEKKKKKRIHNKKNKKVIELNDTDFEVIEPEPELLLEKEWEQKSSEDEKKIEEIKQEMLRPGEKELSEKTENAYAFLDKIKTQVDAGILFLNAPKQVIESYINKSRSLLRNAKTPDEKISAVDSVTELLYVFGEKEKLLQKVGIINQILATLRIKSKQKFDDLKEIKEKAVDLYDEAYSVIEELKEDKEHLTEEQQRILRQCELAHYDLSDAFDKKFDLTEVTKK